MPITYDPNTNTITVVDFPETSPCTFEDIYQADVSNGWGVVSKQGENQYKFSCKLRIGDGATETWLIDKNKMVLHDIDDHFIYVAKYGHLRLGTVVDEAKRTTKDGCYLYTLGDNYYFIEFVEGSSLELYSSILASSKRTYLLGTEAGSGHRIWNCIFFRVMPWGRGAKPTDVELHRVTWQSSRSAMGFQSTYAYDIVGTDCTYGAMLVRLGFPVTFRNVKLINEGTSFLLQYVDVNVYTVNVECKWTFLWLSSPNAKVYRQYTFKLKVVDENGNPISGARVKVWDKFGNLVVDVTTDANGEIPEQTITRGHYDQEHGNELQDYSPHTLEVTKQGFESYRTTFILEKPIDWIVRLKREYIYINVDEEVLL